MEIQAESETLPPPPPPTPLPVLSQPKVTASIYPSTQVRLYETAPVSIPERAHTLPAPSKVTVYVTQ